MCNAHSYSYVADFEFLFVYLLVADMLRTFPPPSVCLKRPFSVKPWINSEENIGNLLMVFILGLVIHPITCFLCNFWLFLLVDFLPGGMLCMLHISFV